MLQLLDNFGPRLQTITPREGAAIMLKKMPDGSTAFKLKRGIDFDHPDAIKAEDVCVGALFGILKKADIPGLELGKMGIFNLPTIATLAVEQGIGILIKKNDEGKFEIKVQSPCDLDDPDTIFVKEASLKYLLEWVEEAFRSQ